MSNIDNFRNNVFCRNDINQHKARNIWNIIKNKIDDNDKNLFLTEWSHYMIGEIDVDEFAFYFDTYVKKYFN